MKFTSTIATVLFCATTRMTCAFTVVGPSTTHHHTLTRRFLNTRINESIDLESAKVATMETLTAPSKKVYCRCWQSGTFPLCDGTHAKHNEKTGDNVGPLIVTVKKEE